MEPFIIGGQIAKIEQFPHVVYVLLTCNGLSWICGGSVLTQNLVLTAAHCFRSCPRDLDASVYVGSAEIRKVKVTRLISIYVIHDNFDARTNSYDIALARTTTDMPLSKKIKRVVIKKRFPDVNRAEVAGWGIPDDLVHLTADRLQWLPQNLQSTGICSGFAISPGMICNENSVDRRPSPGDSGSPLTVNFVQQIGLVSFRHPRFKQLLVYTNVSYYYDWIKWAARELSCAE